MFLLPFYLCDSHWRIHCSIHIRILSIHNRLKKQLQIRPVIAVDESQRQRTRKPDWNIILLNDRQLLTSTKQFAVDREQMEDIRKQFYTSSENIRYSCVIVCDRPFVDIITDNSERYTGRGRFLFFKGFAIHICWRINGFKHIWCANETFENADNFARTRSEQFQKRK